MADKDIEGVLAPLVPPLAIGIALIYQIRRAQLALVK